MGFCLTKNLSAELKRKIKSGELDPEKLASMTSEARRAYFEEFLGKDNAVQVNALLERKLIMKNYQLGLINGIKQITGMKPQVRADLISRIGKMDKILNPAEEKAFMKDLANKALGFEFDAKEAKTISELSTKMQELKAKANTEGKFPTETDRLDYGMSSVLLKKFVDDLKLESRKISFREQPARAVADAIGKIPGIMKSAIASFDNSFWGRQGIKTFWDFKTSGIWGKNFLKSWRDIGKQLTAKGKFWKSGDDAVMDAIKADVVSRPNAVNGKYKAGGYGLDVMNEEAFPTSIPEKIPLLGRVFKASETAYSGGALRLRADLADRIIKIAEQNGINTLDPKQAKGIGQMISSLTGRGSLGKGEVLAKEANVLMFSIKFLKANIDTVTAPLRYLGEKIGFKAANEGESFAIKESAKSTLRMVATIAATLTLAETLSPGSTDKDSRSTNFGKIKLFGHWTDISGGMASLVVLASRLVPTLHDGKLSFWTKNSNGVYRDLLSGDYGSQTAWDVINDFWSGKLSPVAGVARDIWSGKNFDGQAPTLENIIKGNVTPLSIQTYDQLKKEPASSFVFGSMLMDALGFSVSSSIAPNSKTKLIPEGQSIKNEDLITGIQVYAQAMGVDPETAFNRIFTGQKIVKVTNGTIMVERMSAGDSQSVKKKAGANNPQMKLDHTVPLELGGDNSNGNLKIVTTSEWSSYTKIENALGKALKEKRIDKQTAQNEIKKFKAIQDSSARKAYGESLIQKYSGKTSSLLDSILADAGRLNPVKDVSAAELSPEQLKQQPLKYTIVYKQDGNYIRYADGGETGPLTESSTITIKQKIEAYNRSLKLPKNETITTSTFTPSKNPRKIPGFKTWDPPENLSKIVVAKAQKHGIPPSVLAGLIQTESGFNVNAPDNTSVMQSGIKSRDRGLAQISDYWNPDVSDAQAHDPEFAIDFAAKKLAEQLKRYKDLRQAIASYNVGNRVGLGQGRNERGLGPAGELYLKKVIKNLDPEELKKLGID